MTETMFMTLLIIDLSIVLYISVNLLAKFHIQISNSENSVYTNTTIITASVILSKEVVSSFKSSEKYKYR